MSQLEQLVDKLRQRQGKELLLLPGANPRYLSGKGWMDLDTESLTAVQAQQACLSLLTKEEQEKLTSHGQVRGSVFSKKGYSISYSVQSCWSGYMGHFEVGGGVELDSDVIGVPEVVRQVAGRPNGLILVCGPRRSGKTTVLASLLKTLNQNSSKAVATFAAHPFFIMNSERSTLMHFSLDSLSGRKGIDGRVSMADVLVLDSIRDKGDMDICFQALEQGKLVLASYESLSVKIAIKRIISSFALEDREMASELLVEHLHLAVGQRLAPSQDEGQWSLASEVLVNTPEVKTVLKGMNWDEVMSLMKTRGEKTGMRSLNQSLLQLLLRRKITLQTAYELSPEIEELHTMMEKVGV